MKPEVLINLLFSGLSNESVVINSVDVNATSESIIAPSNLMMNEPECNDRSAHDYGIVVEVEEVEYDNNFFDCETLGT